MKAGDENVVVVAAAVVVRVDVMVAVATAFVVAVAMVAGPRPRMYQQRVWVQGSRDAETVPIRLAKHGLGLGC
eukprot:359372-Chlamydomonas_euryale.AAC.2